MNNRIHYTKCPVCSGTSLSPVLEATDNTVSKEKFPVWQCADCTLRFTQDVPTADTIGPYYKSEEYISHTNTSKGLINRLYHVVRGITLRNKRKLIESETPSGRGRLLDVGSGTGAFAGEMKKAGWNTTGLEPDPEARKVALTNHGITLEDMDRFHKLEPGFNAITLWHVLEHVHELHPYIARLRELLAADGRIFIAVPNYTSLDARKYEGAWAAYDVPRHLYHFSPASIRALMQANGLVVKKYKPMWFDSFYISLLSSKIKSGSTSWLGAVSTGIRSNMKALSDTQKCSSVIYIISRS
ncbi:MAG: class I SAM-dependent methyltransferase [Chitinophagaceae bacterium]|nr:MAG: class I SAM-dependent methyltransferase [Chitinophagaceae bacterium]